MLSFMSEVLELGRGATGLLAGSTAAISGVLDLVRKPNPDLTEIKARAAEAIDKLLEAKAAQMQMQEKLLELERDLKKRDRFQEQAARYQMTRTDMGSLVYSLKAGEDRGEPAHDLCAACFEDEVKSVLQPSNFNALTCPKCGSTVRKHDGQEKVFVVPRAPSIFD